ncbi:excinuclease ABC subunit A [[Pantoea] beijingensis]|uniref:Excinuclease ABC subunit A n=1 Tax=[Pantoea] beijingensis TaxID=1324864 RepID=A0A443IC74_9GAMM|nr:MULTISPECIES: GIY-YIG nuclease family protein [Erwiniaceae]RWR01486.1 excinuclease ABC subunit A [[Pantoea] beijingensis]
MNTESAPVWQLYILRTAAGMFYTGITNNVQRRFQQHQTGKGAKALRGKGPLALLFCCEVGDRASASKLEYLVKQLKKRDKIRLVESQPASLTEWLLRNGQNAGHTQ